ncbi:hypothetical protein FIBSPDRAFT_850940 [Athelia psychrophila]|uniref:Uncharacterized protein n=1 Tax=Athelia psychrophila TaxID=1759441 RepID=A0A166T566_9AGAM|nr:hypothetical protein FIBSPDRAFT_850940 [Fibularhizoctonia sp. CBS 109695]
MTSAVSSSSCILQSAQQRDVNVENIISTQRVWPSLRTVRLRRPSLRFVEGRAGTSVLWLSRLILKVQTSPSIS